MTKTLWGPDKPIFPRFPQSGRKNELMAIKTEQTVDMAAEQTVITNLTLVLRLNVLGLHLKATLLTASNLLTPEAIVQRISHLISDGVMNHTVLTIIRDTITRGDHKRMASMDALMIMAPIAGRYDHSTPIAPATIVPNAVLSAIKVGNMRASMKGLYPAIRSRGGHIRVLRVNRAHFNGSKQITINTMHHTENSLKVIMNTGVKTYHRSFQMSKQSHLLQKNSLILL